MPLDRSDFREYAGQKTGKDSLHGSCRRNSARTRSQIRVEMLPNRSAKLDRNHLKQSKSCCSDHCERLGPPPTVLYQICAFPTWALRFVVFFRLAGMQRHALAPESLPEDTQKVLEHVEGDCRKELTKSRQAPRWPPSNGL